MGVKKSIGAGESGEWRTATMTVRHTSLRSQFKNRTRTLPPGELFKKEHVDNEKIELLHSAHMRTNCIRPPCSASALSLAPPYISCTFFWNPLITLGTFNILQLQAQLSSVNTRLFIYFGACGCVSSQLGKSVGATRDAAGVCVRGLFRRWSGYVCAGCALPTTEEISLHVYEHMFFHTTLMELK